jgi:hypothetical protein
MSLLNKLTTQGSNLSAANGGAIPTNILATKSSKLHADGSNPGYSLNGANASEVNNAYQEYKDGAVNIIPQPSQLDLNGQTPSKYTDNLPQ